ncbi:MAG: AAA family ATPase [Magnetococcales bacterium]|nr:AAA family ATPase [Magnetococcales bacterium]
MNYLEHFGLQTTPFSLTPDTEFLFEDLEFSVIARTVLVALEEGEGIVKVTGDIGTGKTMLGRYLLGTLEKRYAVAYLLNPLLSVRDLNQVLATEFGVEAEPGMGFQMLLSRILERLMLLGEEGKKALILVDEAQSVPDSTLEALRLMTNLETEKEKVVQVVLLGQLELDQRLEQPEVRALKQRIATSCHLRPMDFDRLQGYVRHRLQAAGGDKREIFTPGALELLFRGSRGSPRLVHILANKALGLAAEGKESGVTARHMRRAIQDTEGVSTVTPRVRLFFGMLLRWLHDLRLPRFPWILRRRGALNAG